MKNSPKVSIIVPIFNCEKYLNKCINSLLSQTEKNIEVILINDGSTDNSYNVARKYELIDSRIKLINQENNGVSFTRNKGIEISSGEYIMFIDSDDWIEENTLEIMLNSLKKFKSNYVRIACTKDIVDIGKNYVCDVIFDHPVYVKRESFKYEVFNAFLNTYSLNSPCLFLVKRELLRKNNIYFDVNRFYGEDLLFNIEIFKYLENAIFLPNPCYHYVYNTNSLTTNNSKEIIEKKIYNAILNYSALFKLVDLFEVTDSTVNDKINNRILKEVNECIINIYCNNLIIPKKDRLFLINLANDMLKEKCNVELYHDIKKIDNNFLLKKRTSYIIKKYIRRLIAYIYRKRTN